MIDKMIIKDLVKQAVPDICAMRRHIHENPELSGEEVETAAFMAAKLRSFGIDVQEHVAGTTAVLGTLKGGKPGPVIALRADMDALPMTEETGLPFASNFPGKMHACGHDGHMSILLGAAKVLSQVKDDIPGTVVFICQPAEEKSPVGGAKGLVASGVLDGVDAVYGLHVWPALPSGKIGVLPGPMMAASDHIRIIINGKASHAAMPHKGVDTIVAAAQFLTAAQTIISRRVNPLYPAVLTFGRITGGTRYNVVADTVEIEGTCRTYHAAFDPVFADAYEEQNSAKLGYGICLCKYTGARGKAGSNDANAEFMAKIRRIFNEKEVPWQVGELGKVDQGGGGTIAYIMADWGCDVVDCGVAMHSMHAPLEIVAKADAYSGYLAYKAFFESK